MREAPFWRRHPGLPGRDPAAGVDDELEFHLAMRVEDLMRRGVPEAEARERAKREFGDVERVRGELRRMARRRLQREKRSRWWESRGRDLRFAGRTLRKSPGFTAVIVGTLALGIGASTTMFSVVNGVVLKALPYDEPESLVLVWPETVSNVRMTEWLSDNTRSFREVSGITGYEFAITGEGESEQIAGARVSPNHFDVMGARPLLGRTFRREEADPGRSRVAVLSHALWRTRYGGDPEVVGRTIRIDSSPYTVIGVMAPDYRGLEPGYRLWVPQAVEPGTTVGTDETWWVRTRIGRLSPGVSVEAAQRELRTAAVRLADEFPMDLDRAEAGRATVVRLRAGLVGSFGRALWILLGAVGLVLLIACSNVANLLLARAEVRQRDVALRTAIGASRRQVISHLLTNSLVLGVLGGIAGMILAWAALAVLESTAPGDLPRIDEVGVDGTVLLFGVGASLLTPLIFGLLPAYRATGRDVREVLSSGARGSAGTGSRSRLASGLVAAEVAIAVVLVIGAGLMAKSLWRLEAVDPGFRADGVLTLQIAIPASAAEGSARPDMATYREIWDALAAVPGVEAAGGIQVLPLTGGNNRYPYWAQDNEPPGGSRPPAANIRVATPGYLEAMGIDLEEGRWFGEADRMNTPPVMVINQALATRLWPGESPIGKQIRLLDEGSFTWEVVGVIADINQMGLDRDPSGEMYLPHEQWPWGRMFLTIRGAGSAESLIGPVRRAIRLVDDDITIARVATMEQVVAASVTPNRFLAGLLGAFGMLALSLGAIGVYGVMTYTVSRRIPEFGLRMALGSSPRGILKEAMAQGLRPVVIGIVIGLGAAWVTTRVLSAMLFGVEPTDPPTYAAVVGVLVAVACVASYLPARRASSVEPIGAMRTQ